MAKVLSVLYDDPVDGYPQIRYPRDGLPKLDAIRMSRLCRPRRRSI